MKTIVVRDGDEVNMNFNTPSGHVMKSTNLTIIFEVPNVRILTPDAYKHRKRWWWFLGGGKRTFTGQN